ncbi:glutathione reductase, mitochondrial-like isoform X2 [Centruroides sculpturatus]|uniref:glutathione reductase, mitochondrial-like isoform X2 n=1 Tax=Centruroides sculpturatus TaxID=218467 RepID=UPI000C6DD27E|nr:glutathione reductase, mitochondrial-like isoform X2 [Centruroides sculpturatus]
MSPDGVTRLFYAYGVWIGSCLRPMRIFGRKFALCKRFFGTINAGMEHYEYLVIGGGSGGIASARKAAEFGTKVALIESHRLGGTCVNVGCVPKKLSYYCAQHAETIRDHGDYGFDVVVGKFDWSAFKKKRDDYVKHLNEVYRRNLDKSGVAVIKGEAKFVDRRTVEVEGKRYSGERVLIATGGRPLVPEVPGAELGITSDGFFRLEEVPGKTVIAGAGYIAVELAGILNAVGSRVSLVVRGDKVLRTFDSTISGAVTEEMEAAGINIFRRETIEGVKKAEDGKLILSLASSEKIEEVECLLWAVGRRPNTGLDLDRTVSKAGGNWDLPGFKASVVSGSGTGRRGIRPSGPVPEHLVSGSLRSGRRLRKVASDARGHRGGKTAGPSPVRAPTRSEAGIRERAHRGLLPPSGGRRGTDGRRGGGPARKRGAEDIPDGLRSPVPRADHQEDQMRHEAGVSGKGGKGDRSSRRGTGVRRDAAGIRRGRQDGRHQTTVRRLRGHPSHFRRRIRHPALTSSTFILM